MTQQNIQLKIGDKIGFVSLAGDIDSDDTVNFFPVVEVTTRDEERAYRYQFPDGSVSSAAVRESDLASHTVQIVAQSAPSMLNLSERKGEFREALERGKDNQFEVFADWEKDAFVVVNKESLREYRVTLESRDEAVFGGCECGDFKFRRRTCKHLSEVLTFTLFTVKV